MQEVVKIISQNGIWVFLIGVLTSILIGLIKTPIRAKWIDSLVDGEQKKKRENIFDTLVFLSTYAMAFLAAIVYYTAINKSFDWLEILSLSLPIWLSQSMAYGAWKKLGIKRFLALLAKLIFKDTNKDGEVSLDEAISQVVKGIKDGKFGIDDLVSTVNDNLGEVVEDIAASAEGTKEAELAAKMAEGGADEMAENIKKEVVESAKDVANIVIGKLSDGTEVSIGSQQIIKF